MKLDCSVVSDAPHSVGIWLLCNQAGCCKQMPLDLPPERESKGVCVCFSDTMSGSSCHVLQVLVVIGETGSGRDHPDYQYLSEQAGVFMTLWEEIGSHSHAVWDA